MNPVRVVCSQLQSNDLCNPLMMHSKLCEVIAHTDVTARTRKTNSVYIPNNKRGALSGRGKGRGRPHSESPATTKRQPLVNH